MTHNSFEKWELINRYCTDMDQLIYPYLDEIKELGEGTFLLPSRIYDELRRLFYMINTVENRFEKYRDPGAMGYQTIHGFVKFERDTHRG